MDITKTKQITSLTINNEYSLSGKAKVISYENSEDIHLEVKSLSAIRHMSNLKTIKTIKDYYPDIKILNISGNINYLELLGSKKSKEYSSYLKEKIQESLSLVTSYHTDIFPIRRKCYQNLSQVKLNDQILEIPHYNHAGVTGRTSIKKGYNFLTMKKQKRSELNCIDKNNVLIEVDFKSCEPFFYLKSNGFCLDNVRDVYTWISDNYKVTIKSREEFKRGILSMLYGANEYTISKVMKTNLKTVKKIKEDLKIDLLSQRLNEEFNKNNFILNYYGRPVTSNNNLVNYWIQSSAVDFCSLAFYEFFKENDIKPCFFIHDSMTFEIPRKRLEEIKEVKQIKESKSNITIPVEFNVLSV